MAKGDELYPFETPIPGMGCLMMSPPVECPDRSRIAAYTRTDLSAEDAAAVEKHLAACRACLDEFVALGRRSLAPDVPGCQIVKEIGRGRFGVVYKAWRLNDPPRVVALKVLSCPGEMEKHRFDREIAVLKKLDSPSIVKCIDSGETGDAVYFIMDFVEGVHLDEYLKSSSDDLNARLRVFERVCRAVADAHAHGVVHRDLKPRNILVEKSGLPHVLDFGICSVLMPDWSSWAQQTLTLPGDIVGTLKYMSPEQAWGGVAGTIDERSDIWALGVMLFEIVTDGGYPYSLEAAPDKPVHEALIERIRKEMPRRPRLDALPRGRDLETLVERCLAWEPDRRIESAAQLADDVDRYVQGRRINTKPLSWAYRLRRLAVGASVRSRWMFSAAFTAATALTLSVILLVFGVGWYVRAATDGPGAPSRGLAAASADARDRMLVVGVFDDSVTAIKDFAAAKDIPGVTADPRSWRAVHGKLMERLVEAKPSALVWDYYFASGQPNDADLVAGITGLEESGVPVILAAHRYDDDGVPALSPYLLEKLGRNLRHGAIMSRDMVREPGAFLVAFKPSSRTVVPSVAVTTLAALLHSETRLELEWPTPARSLSVLHEIKPGAYLRERGRIDITTAKFQKEPQPVMAEGSPLALSTMPLDRPEHWRDRTVPYDRLLTCPTEELRELTSNRLLVVGDFRRPSFGAVVDRYPVKYGSEIVDDVPGCYLLSDSIAGLLNGRYLRLAFALPLTTFAVMVLLSVIGCLLTIPLAIARPLEQPHRRGPLWATLAALAGTSFVVLTAARNVVSVHAAMAAFSLALPMIGAFWVEFARNRHRLADRQRRAVESFGLTTDGTITLPRKPPT